MGNEEPSVDYEEAGPIDGGRANAVPSYPMSAPEDDFEEMQKKANEQTKLLNMFSGGRRTRRRRRRLRHRLDDKELKRVIAQHRRFQIARGDKRFKATKRLVKWSRPNKTSRSNRIYYRKRKKRTRRRKRQRKRQRKRRRRRKRQRGGAPYQKPGIGSEDSICGSFQTPEERKYTPDKWIVVPQPPGGSGGMLDANQTAIKMAQTFVQAKANSEGDWSTPDSKFEDDKQDIGNLKIGGRRKSRKKRRRKRRRTRKRRGGGWGGAIGRPAGGWKNIPNGIIKIKIIQGHALSLHHDIFYEGKFELKVWPQEYTDSKTLYFKKEGVSMFKWAAAENWIKQIQIWDGVEEGGGSPVAPKSSGGKGDNVSRPGGNAGARAPAPWGGII